MENKLITIYDKSDLKNLFHEVLDERDKKHQESKTIIRKITYLNRYEVAESLRISLPTLANWTKEGIVQGYRIGNRVLYREDEINSSVKEIRNMKYKRG